MHRHEHVVAAGDDGSLVVHDTVGKQVTDDRNGVTGEGQLPTHRQGHGTTKEEEEYCRPHELHGDHLVIGVPDVMHDPGLSVTMMTFAVGLHGRYAVVGN